MGLRPHAHPVAELARPEELEGDEDFFVSGLGDMHRLERRLTPSRVDGPEEDVVEVAAEEEGVLPVLLLDPHADVSGVRCDAEPTAEEPARTAMEDRRSDRIV